MAKKQTFANKLQGKGGADHCPVCDGDIQRVKQVRAVKAESGAWKFRSLNVKLCKCTEKEMYS